MNHHQCIKTRHFDQWDTCRQGLSKIAIIYAIMDTAVRKVWSRLRHLSFGISINWPKSTACGYGLLQFCRPLNGLFQPSFPSQSVAFFRRSLLNHISMGRYVCDCSKNYRTTGGLGYRPKYCCGRENHLMNYIDFSEQQTGSQTVEQIVQTKRDCRLHSAHWYVKYKSDRKERIFAWW